ncbi:DNA-binding transcriptional activator of the SARP family [Micromonospora rhizosphaerae]|uniref:DNA-binding transcriptional activator of the SARP family n=1 Tax=Micromonospora rhizosphaerae TaxID=568872 RepID=A0A1C6R9C7_9ACTN|nr:BTAD domain-containing putative transcriptional regulator [Micromonospora rhizosphaerae]SCL13721.1 DNA-binding transcriptional activator of the SARP family [Micromonospora rhizosphaerae]
MSGTLRFEILGPQRAWYADRQLDLGPGKQRAVLAVLLLSVGRPVPTGQIVEAVWPEEPPANGPNVVQKYVAGLRRVLEPDRSPRTPGQVLTLTDAGYLLRVAPEAVDAVRFERAVHRARQRHAGGRTAEALNELKVALELWQGEPFTGFAGPVFEAARHRLVELRAVALETRVELELETGRHRDLVGELVELVADFPVRERLRHQLMLALYRSGRQAEALAAYREFDDLLRGEYGIEPGEALRDLHRRILRSDPTLSPALPSPVEPAASDRPTAGVPTPAVPAQTGPAGPEEAASGVPADPAVPGPVTPASTPDPADAPAGRPPPVTTGLAPSPVGGFAPTPPSAVGFPPGPVGSPVAMPGPSAGPGFVPPATVLPPPPYEPVAGPPSQGVPRWLSVGATVLGALAALLSFGFLTWLVVLVYGIWRRSWRNALAAVGYLSFAVTFFVVIGSSDPDAEMSDPEGFLFLGWVLAWIFGVLHVVLLNGSVWAAITGGTGKPAAPVVDDRRVRREQARYLLYHYPAARQELHIGRPDLPRTFDDGGLVDINAVGEKVIAGLPGMTAEQGRQVAMDRWLRGPFGSMEDLAARCLLPPMLTDSLRDLLVFLPPLPGDPPPTTLDPTPPRPR